MVARASNENISISATLFVTAILVLGAIFEIVALVKSQFPQVSDFSLWLPQWATNSAMWAGSALWILVAGFGCTETSNRNNPINTIVGLLILLGALISVVGIFKEPFEPMAVWLNAAVWCIMAGVSIARLPDRLENSKAESAGP